MKYKNDFRIENDGDSLEKISWSLFVRDKFPNYDVFWANYIAPNTRRPVDIWFKDDVDEDIRILSMLHYGIFKHFLFIYQNIVNSNNRDLFDCLYIHLSSICDLSEELLLRVLLYTHKVDKTKLMDDVNNNKFKIDKAKVRKAINKGQNYSIKVFSRISVLKKFYDSTLITRFEKISSEIRTYRNLLIHSWPLFQIDVLVPKKEIVINQDFRDWTKIVNMLNNVHLRENYIKANFIQMGIMLINDTEELIAIINKVWDRTIDLMNEFDYANKI